MKRAKRSMSETGRKQTASAIAIFAASAAVIGVFVLYAAQGQRPAIGPDGCRIGQTVPDAHTVVLIDQTDKLNEDQLIYVRTLVLQEYLRLGEYGRFSVIGLEAGSSPDSSGEASEQATPADLSRKLPNFSRCRIQTGAEADWTTQNEVKVGRRFQQLVGGALSKTIDELRNVPPAPVSPILETIDRLSASTTFGSPRIQRRLVIISDMAQHVSDGISHYPPARARFAYAGGAPRSAGDLSGLSVRVHYVTRPDLKAVQNADHRAYWLDYFKQSGAEDVAIGWGLSPDAKDDVLLPVRDLAKAPASAPLFKADVPGSNSSEPAFQESEKSPASNRILTNPEPRPAAGNPKPYSADDFSPGKPVRVMHEEAKTTQRALTKTTTPSSERVQQDDQVRVAGQPKRPEDRILRNESQNGPEVLARSRPAAIPLPSQAVNATPGPAAATTSARTIEGKCILPDGSAKELPVATCRRSGGVLYPVAN